jgi:ring-1,2-phenylacetyl-CoA epoxidase subunit PaaC
VTELEPATRDAVAELLLTLADDEFVLGFWDSEWTGIAPMLEEDVATSSIAQDEIGHARAWFGLLAELTDDDPDRIAFGRAPDAYRHASLMNHPRTDWAFTVARRFLYETADAVRLEALAASSHAAIAGLAGKMRREETYHLLHWSAWMRRLAEGGSDTRGRLTDALARLWPDAESVFSPLNGEAELLAAGILPESLDSLRTTWHQRVDTELAALGLSRPAGSGPAQDGRTARTDDFRWLWREFTSVARTEPGATW